jgi:hypothetical protein
MDNNEMLYELSLMYNTLKMYENTLDQMRKNGVSSEESIKRIENEKQSVEAEFIELLNPSTKINETGRKSPKIDEKVLSENEFIKAQKTKAKYKKLYDNDKNFFDSITKENELPNKVLDAGNDFYKYTFDNPNTQKPTFAEIQDNISNSQWISCSNFIVEFPKNEIDIDEWRVSSLYYRPKQNVSCRSQRCSFSSGELFISVNDFSDKKEDGTYKILAKIINKLSKQSNAHVVGDIHVRVISNDGDLLYTMCFENCRFITSDSDGFSYETTGLRKVNLTFEYDELHVLSPDEKLCPKELR